MVNMIARICMAVLAMAFCVIPITGSRAQDACGPLDDITKQLAGGKYHEQPAARAIAITGTAIILFVGPGGATWTLVGIPKGHPSIGCLLSAGTDWQIADPPPKGNPS